MKRYIVEVTEVRIGKGWIEGRSSEDALSAAEYLAAANEYPMETIDRCVEIKLPEDQGVQAA